MPRPTIATDAIAGVLCRLVLNDQLTGKDQCLLDEWESASSYNRAVVYDLQHDPFLRQKIIDACGTESSGFWLVLLTYRAALHGGMSPRQGNFWHRMIHDLK